jgi:hypothetical protein
MWEMLTQREGEEPVVDHFNGLEWEAGDVFAGDVEWIRRLRSAGLVRVALEAAIRGDGQIAGLEPILMELGREAEPFDVWQISHHLACWYRRVHPRGEQLGFVRRVTAAPDVDLFLITDEDTPGQPRIVIVYPKVEGDTFDDATAWE